MSDRTEGADAEAPAKRGEAAWREQKDAIAARNAQARKAGRAEREEREKKDAGKRRDRELLERASLDKL